MENFEIVYGIHPVEEALNSNKKILKLIIRKEKRINPRIISLITQAEVKNIKIKYINPEEISQYTNETNIHQGIIAQIQKETRTDKVDFSKNLYLILDHITDVHNLGAIMRNAEFFKVDGIILPKDRSVPINDAVAKSSSGAIFHLNMIHVSNINQEIDKFKDNGFWISGADVQGNKNLNEFEFPQKSVIVFGNEEKGLHRLVKEKLDYRVNIPGFGKTQSLNVSVSTALFLFQYRKYWK